MLISGMSIPSLKRSTVKTKWTSRLRNRPRTLSRSARGVSALTAIDAMPASSNIRAIKVACSTLTQKPRPTISSIGGA